MKYNIYPGEGFFNRKQIAARRRADNLKRWAERLLAFIAGALAAALLG